MEKNTERRSPLRKLYAASMGGFGRAQLRSNILTGSRYNMIGGNTIFEDDEGNRNSPSVGNALTNRLLSTYYSKMKEIRSYELNELSETIISVIRDYMINFMNKSGDLITIKDDSTRSKKVNDVLINDLNLQEFIRSHLNDVIFYGAYHSMLSSERDETGHRRFSLTDMYDPLEVVTKFTENEDPSYIVKGSNQIVYEVPYTQLIKIGDNNLRLIDDLSDERPDGKKNLPESPSKSQKCNRDHIISEVSYAASKPMYYTITHKVKEYLLKDTIISLLSIKDLIQPILMMIHVDKGTPIETANELSKRAENLINKYTDLSQILSAQFSITDLIESLLNNIRVLPDYSDSLTNMNTVDISKVTNKIQEIRMELDNVRETVLNAMGIPLDLFSGRVTKWEALKTSERLNSKINSYVMMIKKSVSEVARVIYRNLYDEDLDVKDIEVHMFTRTTVEYNNMLNNAESISNVFQQLNIIVDIAMRTAETAGEMFDKTKYFEYVSSMLRNVDPNISEFITDERLESFSRNQEEKQKLTDVAQVTVLKQQAGLGPDDDIPLD